MSTLQSRESSVTLALAEIDRLEHDRAEFAAARASGVALAERRARELDELRERLEAERPRAWARARARATREEQLELRARELQLTHAAAAHELEMARLATELEAKRRELSVLEALPVVDTPARKLLEWSMPVAAAGLLALFGATLIHEDEAVAASSIDPWVLADSSAATVSALPAPLIPTQVEAPEPAPEPAAAPSPASESKSSKSKSSKSKSSKSKSTKTTKSKDSDEGKSKSTPGTNPRSNPLELGDFGGNPLG
ncbi:hypothetical protein G6O69_12975 [Pseudenhygromyxa sp. WMMC2535]|uniref:hypothetical protein n=1 Tax=Pseudenhygromyxa sp. WMMC2535 TaxID=2712867 RepID=UPI0015548B40|nr:hypothetical protein [Pseudenhygromyxa sp. WMMC2535]NVB38746.1 hypothetical protein [Pseudenhygromyxa sp. WMMC2535]